MAAVRGRVSLYVLLIQARRSAEKFSNVLKLLIPKMIRLVAHKPMVDIIN